MLNKFFHFCERISRSRFRIPTVVLVSEKNSDGSSVIVSKVLETLDNPFAALSYDDFSLQRCIENGVTYNSLGISKDMRMGHEQEFEALESRFNEMSDKIFVQPSNEQ